MNPMTDTNADYLARLEDRRAALDKRYKIHLSACAMFVIAVVCALLNLALQSLVVWLLWGIFFTAGWVTFFVGNAKKVPEA